MPSAAVVTPSEGCWVEFGLEGGRGAARVGGDTARYRDVLTGVSAEYTPAPDAVKENLILGSPQAASFASRWTPAQG